MRRFVLLLGLAMFFSIAGKAQEGYQINGKINGMQDGTLLLMSDENGKPERLGSSQITNGTFVFTGKVDSPMSAYIIPEGGEGMIPLILENAHFMINVGSAGALIKGGEQQEIFGEFSRINSRLLQEQQRIQKLYDEAELSGDQARVNSLMKEFEEAIASARKEERALQEKYRDMYVTAYVIAAGMRGDSEESLRAKYEILGEKARATVPGKRIAATLDQFTNLIIGRTVADFSMNKPDGNTFSLYGVPARFKLLHFWSSTDAASRQATPDLVRLYLQYRPKGLEIISVSLDTDRGAWRNAIGLDGMIWTNVSDLQGFDSEVARYFLVNELPCNFLLDAENNIVAKNLDAKELGKKLGDLTKKKKK